MVLSLLIGDAREHESWASFEYSVSSPASIRCTFPSTGRLSRSVLVCSGDERETKLSDQKVLEELARYRDGITVAFESKDSLAKRFEKNKKILELKLKFNEHPQFRFQILQRDLLKGYQALAIVRVNPLSIEKNSRKKEHSIDKTKCNKEFALKTSI